MRCSKTEGSRAGLLGGSKNHPMRLLELGARHGVYPCLANGPQRQMIGVWIVRKGCDGWGLDFKTPSLAMETNFHSCQTLQRQKLLP